MNMTPEEILMPAGKIPLPAWVPKRALYPGSSFEFYSRRLGRFIYLTYENEYLFALLVEFNPNIQWFVEHYPRVKLLIDNKHVQTTFDMLVRFVSGKFLLVEVKDDKNSLSSRGEHQIMRQRIFAQQCQVQYVVVDRNDIRTNKVLISNLNDIRGYLALRVTQKIKEDAEMMDYILISIG